MDINALGFSFVNKIKVIESKDVPNHDTTEYLGEKLVGNIGEVSDFKLFQTDPFNSKKVKHMFEDIGGKLNGLDIKEYEKFQVFIENIYALEYYSDKFDFETLRKCVWEWVINIYKTKVAETSLTSYLYEAINMLSDEFTFVFRVDSLIIEEGFKIGNCEIKSFTKEEIETYFQEDLKSNPERSFMDYYNSFEINFKSINVQTKSKGVYNRAKEKARWDSENAINVLKCFCTDLSLYPYNKMLDLSHNFQQNVFATLLYTESKSGMNWGFEGTVPGGKFPIAINSKWINTATEEGLTQFSNFIAAKSKTEYSQVLLRAIGLLSEITSTSDNYQKAIKSISLLEFIVTDINGKPFSNVKKVLEYFFIKSDYDKIILVANQFYNVRNSYLHNGRHHPIVIENLRQLLIYQRLLIGKLINLNQRYSTMSELWIDLGFLN